MRKPWSVVASASCSLAATCVTSDTDRRSMQLARTGRTGFVTTMAMRAIAMVVITAAGAIRTIAAIEAAATISLSIGLGGLGVPTPAFAEPTFTLTSKDFVPGKPVASAQLFNQGGCHGRNESPQLEWSGTPAGTKSFAITMFDPDAPGPGWWHWAVVGIPADVHQLPSNASASGFLKRFSAVEARNDFGTAGYGGPCPPAGQSHRYIVTVYALGTGDLRLSPGQPAQMFDHEIGTKPLGRASMTVTYGH